MYNMVRNLWQGARQQESMALCYMYVDSMHVACAATVLVHAVYSTLTVLLTLLSHKGQKVVPQHSAELRRLPYRSEGGEQGVVRGSLVTAIPQSCRKTPTEEFRGIPR